jgi:hypothetical protein
MDLLAANNKLAHDHSIVVAHPPSMLDMGPGTWQATPVLRRRAAVRDGSLVCVAAEPVRHHTYPPPNCIPDLLPSLAPAEITDEADTSAANDFEVVVRASEPVVAALSAALGGTAGPVALPASLLHVELASASGGISRYMGAQSRSLRVLPPSRRVPCAARSSVHGPVLGAVRARRAAAHRR